MGEFVTFVNDTQYATISNGVISILRLVQKSSESQKTKWISSGVPHADILIRIVGIKARPLFPLLSRRKVPWQFNAMCQSIKHSQDDDVAHGPNIIRVGTFIQ